MATLTVSSTKHGWTHEFHFDAPTSLDDPKWDSMVAEKQRDISALAWNDWKVKVAPGMRAQETPEAAEAYLNSYVYGSKGRGPEILDAKGVKYGKDQLAQLAKANIKVINYTS